MKATRWIRIGLEWIVVAVLAMLILHRFVPVDAADPSAANARPFTLTALDGTPIASSAYQGKAVLLNYWAPWCPPCKMEIPWLQKLHDENRGKLVVVGVVADPSEYAHAAAMMRQKGITYLLAQDSPSLRRTFGDPNSLPTSFYLSPSSHVVHTVTGLVPQYMMHRYAADAIRQK
jgi:thiol-disulfide isomerase/thioredoxin